METMDSDTETDKMGDTVIHATVDIVATEHVTAAMHATNIGDVIGDVMQRDKEEHERSGQSSLDTGSEPMIVHIVSTNDNLTTDIGAAAEHIPSGTVSSPTSSNSGVTKRISSVWATKQELKRSKTDSDDSDSEHDELDRMMKHRLYHWEMMKKMMFKEHHRGPPPVVQHYPIRYPEETPPSDVWNAYAPVNTTGAWTEPVGIDLEKSAWSSPEPGDIPQSQPMDDQQVMNHAGGYVYQVDDLVRVRRMLCLGTEAGTYYQNSLELTLENTQAVSRLLENKRGEELVKEIVKFSNGRAAKSNSLLFVLAMCARQSDHISTKRAAYHALSQVCRIPTHLFIFMEFYNQLGTLTGAKGSGWGRAHRFGIANWYHQFKDNPFKLALHVTKYRQRNGWTHRDVIRLSHPKPNSDRGSPELACVIKYVVKGLEAAVTGYSAEDASHNMKKIIAFLETCEMAKKLTPQDEEKACELIKKYRLVREHLPTELLNSIPVWSALLQDMPITALIRNLGKMTKIGLLAMDSAEAALVIQKLTNQDQLKGARIHPYNVLLAHHQYKMGCGDKGDLTWNPNLDITLALEKAFDMSFKFVEPTNKRFCIALDISGSMDFSFTCGSKIKVRDTAAAMAMVTVRSERRHKIVGFHNNMIQLKITPSMRLSEVTQETKRYGFGGTDCARPMEWAVQNKMLFDAFIVYTDCETHCGYVHPKEALRKYRLASGIHDAKLIVVAMTSNGFTIADPSDPNMLDVVGFDSNAPEIINKFVLGQI